MSDWIDEEARRIAGGARGAETRAAGEGAGGTTDAWDGLRAKVQADVRKINEKLAGPLGGELRFTEPGASAFEVRRQGRHAVSLRVTNVESYVIVKYTRAGEDADTHRTEEFRRLEIDSDEDGNPCLKARDGQLLCLEDASQHLLKPLLG
ncbi:MAG TPA: hypothetical protein VK421_07775 [Pyrinomonadaceae bacterium]|nr:hypothetical protein [Pyrinomonadaceae bacterium]